MNVAGVMVKAYRATSDVKLHELISKPLLSKKAADVMLKASPVDEDVAADDVKIRKL